MATVSSTVGSPTGTGWNRRSSAASFSTYFRYSSSVVAPTHRSSPRARAGFSMLEASIDPSAFPAPTRVCSSSMKRITLPSAAVISFRTAFNRSSNSPRYFAPAMRAPRSRASTRFSFSPSGTSPVTTRWASPSTIAVFPTPGSPMRTGLFFVRRERTWITRRISSSRPMTGSSFWRLAASVRSRQYFSRAWYFASGFSSVIRCVPRMAVSAGRSASRVTPCFRRRSATLPGSDAKARRKCSAERNSSLNASASERARRNSGSRRGDSPRVTAPDTFGSAESSSSASESNRWEETPVRARSSPVTPPSWRRKAQSRCSPSTSAWLRSDARRTASCNASWDFTGSLSSEIIVAFFLLVLHRQQNAGITPLHQEEHRLVGLELLHELRELGRVGHRVPLVDRPDDIPLVEPGLLRRAAVRHPGHHHALRVLDFEPLGDLGGDVLDRESEILRDFVPPGRLPGLPCHLGDRHREGHLLPFPEQPHVRGLPRLRRGHGLRQFMLVLDLLPGERDDHVAGTDPRLLRRAARRHVGHQRPAPAGNPQVLGRLGGEPLDVDPEPSARHLPLVLQLLKDRLGELDRRGEPDPLSALDDRRVDPDDIALQVEEGAARVPGVDRGVGLDEVVVRPGADDPSLGADDPRRHGVAKPERVADRKDPFPHLEPVGVAQGHVGKLLLRVDLDQGDVDLRVGPDDLRLEHLLVEEGHRHLVGLFHHVVVREDVAVRRDDEPGTERLALLLRRHAAEVVVEELVERILRTERVAHPGPVELHHLRGGDVDHRRGDLLEQLGDVHGEIPQPRRRGNHHRLLLFAPEGSSDRRDVESRRQHDPCGHRRENEHDHPAFADHR